jgi:hypothetical protein
VAGSSAGGTAVTVVGQEFLASATCRFGTVAATSTSVTSSTEVVCTAPATAAGSVVVEATNNNVDFTQSNLEYFYYGTSVDCGCGLLVVLMPAVRSTGVSVLAVSGVWPFGRRHCGHGHGRKLSLCTVADLRVWLRSHNSHRAVRIGAGVPVTGFWRLYTVWCR